MANRSGTANAVIQALKVGAPSLDQSTITTMTKLIARDGLPSLTKMEPAPLERPSRETEKKAPLPKLSKSEVIVLTLLGHPNEWFLVLTAKKRRTDVGLSGLGKAFQMTTRREKGEIAHYARFSGDMSQVSEKGIAFIQRLNEKLNVIRESVESGTYAVSSKTRLVRGSLAHASKYPMNTVEATFLRLIETPNTRVLLTSHSTSNEVWHTFRWKWQTRYGFDLSQFEFSQEKQSDGTFNLYGTYTPNKAGGMNQGLREFVEFLHTKPIAGAKASSKGSISIR